MRALRGTGITAVLLVLWLGVACLAAPTVEVEGLTDRGGGNPLGDGSGANRRR